MTRTKAHMAERLRRVWDKRCRCPTSAPPWPQCCQGLPDPVSITPTLAAPGDEHVGLTPTPGVGQPVSFASAGLTDCGKPQSLVNSTGTPLLETPGPSQTPQGVGLGEETPPLPPPPGVGGRIPLPTLSNIPTPSLIFDPKSQPGTPMTAKQLAKPVSNEKKYQDHLKNVRLDTKIQASRYMDEALRVMVDLMRSAESEKIRKEAALDLIQMVMGKPSKPQEDKTPEKPQVIDVEEAVLEAILDADASKNED